MFPLSYIVEAFVSRSTVLRKRVSPPDDISPVVTSMFHLYPAIQKKLEKAEGSAVEIIQLLLDIRLVSFN